MNISFTLREINMAAAKVLEEAGNKKVWAIHGEMGAGKTTFIHALCEVLGVKDTVGSPTYSIINEYRAKNGDIIYHMDLFRLRDEEEALQAGVEDCILSGNRCLIEWPEKAPALLPDNCLHLTISALDSNSRQLKAI